MSSVECKDEENRKKVISLEEKRKCNSLEKEHKPEIGNRLNIKLNGHFPLLKFTSSAIV
jgi:hypothetical protein